MSHGFNHVEVVSNNTRVGEVSIQKAKIRGETSQGHTAGYVFTHPQKDALWHRRYRLVCWCEAQKLMPQGYHP